MSQLQEKQILSFLKILQIPSEQTPDQIKKALLSAGWNEYDANEALRVMKRNDVTEHINTDKDNKNTKNITEPQIITQKYTPNSVNTNLYRDLLNDKKMATSIPLSSNVDVDSGNQNINASRTITTQLPNKTESYISESTQKIDNVHSQKKFIPQQSISAVEHAEYHAPKTQTEKSEKPITGTSDLPVFDSNKTLRSIVSSKKTHRNVDISQELSGEKTLRSKKNGMSDLDHRQHPHIDAPWLNSRIDIYDVSEEDREQMIRSVYRTNEKLNPQTIHTLLGIDVDLSQFEISYNDNLYKNMYSWSWSQIIIIVVLSITLAIAGFIYGMYYFEVGLFHPSMKGI